METDMMAISQKKSMLRYRADWMAKWDDTILEYLNDHETGTPKEITNRAANPVSRQYISRRLKELTENNFTKHLGNGVYRNSKKGRFYLVGAYNPQEERYIKDELGHVELFLLESHKPFNELSKNEDFEELLKMQLNKMMRDERRSTLEDYTG